MKLKEYLEATDQRVAAFAATLGVADNTIRRWLKGQRTPTPDQMRAVFAATKGLVTPNDWVLR